MLAIAQEAQDVDMLLEAYRAGGGQLLGLGRLEEARRFFEAGLALYDPAEHERLAYRFGHDPGVTLHSNLALALWLLGRPEQALVRSQRLLDLLPSFSHPTSLAYAHCFLSKHACMRRDAEVARQHAEEAIRLAQAHGLRSWGAMGRALRGSTLVEGGEAAEGLAQLREGIACWRSMGYAHPVPFFLALEAESFLNMHRLDEGLEVLATARAMAQNGGDTYWSAEVDRLQGELLLERGDAGAAEACFRKALATAREQGARMLELRAATSLARQQLTQEPATATARAARETLAEVYASFPEGLTAADRRSAAALLKSLAAGVLDRLS